MIEEASGGQGTSKGRLARKLSTHQQAVLIHVLLAFPDQIVGVCYQQGANETRDYAEDFLTIFKSIGWTVDRTEEADVLPKVSSGLAIVATDHRWPPSAEALRDALRIYGIEAEIVGDEANLCRSRNFVLAVT